MSYEIRQKRFAQHFNFKDRYIDGVLSLNNLKISKYVEFVYLRELEIKEASQTIIFSSYLDLFPYTDNTRLYDKWDDFKFPIVNFLSSNISSASANGVYVSQLC